MEKRLVLFILCSVVIFTGYGLLRLTLFPPKFPPEQVAQKAEADPADGGGQPADPEKKPVADKGGLAKDKTKPPVDIPDDPEKPAPPETTGPPAERQVPVKSDRPQQWATLGSFAPDAPYRLLVTLTNRGASIERVELVERRKNGKLRYRDLEDVSGYLGLDCHISQAGCEVHVVRPGTPAAMAKPSDGSLPSGIQPGDFIEKVDDTKIDSPSDLNELLSKKEPGDSINILIRRPGSKSNDPTSFEVKLSPRPLALIQPDSPPGKPAVPSFLMGMHQLGARKVEVGEEELSNLPSLRQANWQMEKVGENEVIFRQRLSLGEASNEEQLEIVKRFKAVPATADQLSNHSAAAYHLQMFVEVHNRGKESQELAYALDGPNGLPTEGWWYLNKISPSWGGAGARDVIWRVHDQRHSLLSPTKIFKDATKDPDHSVKPILVDEPDVANRTVDYLGVDTQYFSAVLMAGSVNSDTPFTCRQAYTVPLGFVPELSGREIRTLNTTFRVVTDPIQVEPGASYAQEFHLFLGPKSPKLLDQYRLTSIVEYGWFGWIAKPLSHVLHFFYAIIPNYGLAIILLTVLVRGAMFPIGRKAARNAQTMQMLAPEIKALKEKYKNDMEKQAAAQRELWKKHNFNPLGGCWLMFLQLPIFIGLYRSLSVDIELRQAPLIPGLRWCSNLAGPDMFWNWQSLGLDFMTSKSGWLGPYLNILPIVTVILFIVQQKMFTPPATDEQTRMQQSMMKYMMVFMGVLFFKVPSGLCVYFIASSLWGIGERNLPPPGAQSDSDGPATDKTDPSGKAKPKRGEPKKTKMSIMERIEHWQRMADQKANRIESEKSRPQDRKNRKNRKK